MISSLEFSCGQRPHLLADHTLSCLSSGPQVSKLSVLYAQSPDLPETKLLPPLSQSCGKLKSLNLTWEDVPFLIQPLNKLGAYRVFGSFP
jgi:hypothetical protein